MTRNLVPIGDEDVAIGAPTRLGEAHLVTLVVADADDLEPISGLAESIEASQVRCPYALRGGEAGQLEERVARVLRSRRDRRRLDLAPCVLLTASGPGQYEGQALREDGQINDGPISVTYDRRFGLSLRQER